MLSLLASCAASVPRDVQLASQKMTIDEGSFWSRTNRSSFHDEDGIILVAGVTWPGPQPGGGEHQTDWQLFQNDRLLEQKGANVTLGGKPAHIILHINQGTYSPGSYRAELQVDGKPFATFNFRILPSLSPAALFSVIGPDCQGAPKPAIKAVHFGFPEFPHVAMDKAKTGCAVTSIILDGDGHPAGVRIDAEYPPGNGFGASAARAAWATIYPPGHNGETTTILTRFKAPP